MMQFLKISFKTDKGAEAINLMLIHQIVSFFPNNKLRLDICDFLMIDEILIVIYV